MVQAAVYRMFNEVGDLLYVGQSVTAFQRVKQHAEDKQWFTEVVNITIQWVDASELDATERKAINTENPKYNIIRYSEGSKKFKTPKPIRVSRPVDMEDINSRIEKIWSDNAERFIDTFGCADINTEWIINIVSTGSEFWTNEDSWNAFCDYMHAGDYVVDRGFMWLAKFYNQINDVHVDIGQRYHDSIPVTGM